jgi:hypothetical protein
MNSESLEKNTLIVLCSDCGKYLDIKDGHGVAGTSHGMCEKCQNKFKEKLEKDRKVKL